jgi:hypothetical protein
MSRVFGVGLLIFFLLAEISFSQPTWHIVTVDSDNYEGYNSSLAFDSLNYPHIAYSKFFNPNGPYELKYAFYNGTSWFITSIISGESAYEGSLALDSNNKAHISFNYYQNPPTSYLCYANNITGSWQITNIDANGRFTAIAVDTQNHPHIAYSYNSTTGLKYAYYNGLTWILQTADPQQYSGENYNNSITTDSQDHPHISYCQDATGYLRYAHNDGSGWVIEQINSGGSHGLYTSIVLHNGEPWISDCNPLRYSKKVGSTWQSQNIDSVSYATFTSNALDSSGNQHVAFRDNTLNYLRMANWDGSSYQIETVDPTPGAGMYCSMKIDGNDHPGIAYQNGTPSIMDLMYAWYGEGSIGVAVPSFTAQPAQNGIKLAWQAENSGPAILAGFNLYRIDISHDPDKKYVKLNQNLIIGNSPYTFLDSRIESGINYQYRLWATYTDGSREEVATTECSNSSVQPAAFSLISVYPNPAKSMLTCRLSLSQPSEVNLSLYDISGRLVLAKRYAVPTGEQDINIRLGKLAKGVYTIQVEAGGAVECKRIVVMR